MICSLTGFGSANGRKDANDVVVDVRTVNHRSLDVHVRTPRDCASLEPQIIQAVRQRLVRGRVDVNVQVSSQNSSPVAVDTDAVRGYVEAARRLQAEFQLEGALTLSSILGLPGVVRSRSEDPMEEASRSALSELVLSTVDAALDEAVKMRRTEGVALGAELERHLSAVEASAAEIRKAVPAEREAASRRFEERLSQILPREGIDPVRVAQEVAMLAEKGDISEEIARLDSHTAQFRQLLGEGREIGKKLDFLLQEMQRETNTILSKSGSLELTRLGLAIRADIEKMREQVQNVE